MHASRHGCVAVLCGLVASTLARETVNFDFAWRLGGIRRTDESPPLQVAAPSATCKLIRQLSNDACYIEEHTFGCYENNATMWVAQGCRGIFACGDATSVYCASVNSQYTECSCVNTPTPAPAPLFCQAHWDPTPISPSFNDSSYEVIDAPHDFLISGNFSEMNGNAQAFLPRGLAWYRKHFKLPQAWAGNAIWLYIEGAFHVSQLWLNGVPLGEHRAGYTSFWFRLDSVPGLHFGDAQENVLALHVCAENGTGWWYEGAGLTRHNYLVSTDRLHMEPDSAWVHANVSGAVTASGLLPKDGLTAAAVVHMSATLRNDRDAAANATLHVTFTDERTGVAVGSAESAPVLLPPGAAQAVSLSAPVAVAQLWSIARPYLYTTSFTVKVGGTVVDCKNVTTGIRRVRFHPDTGLHLNDRPTKIRGYCDHSNFGGVGAAVPDRVNLFRAQVGRLVAGKCPCQVKPISSSVLRV
jgi:hypothetical protein